MNNALWCNGNTPDLLDLGIVSSTLTFSTMTQVFLVRVRTRQPLEKYIMSKKHRKLMSSVSRLNVLDRDFLRNRDGKFDYLFEHCEGGMLGALLNTVVAKATQQLSEELKSDADHRHRRIRNCTTNL